MIVKIIERQGTFNIQPRVVRVVRVYDFKVPSGITENVFSQKGGILVGTGAGTFVEFSPGANGQVMMYDSTQALGVSVSTLASVLPRGYIDGLEIANNVADATNDIDFSVGVCRDDSNTLNFSLTSAITKRLDATFTEGNGGGGLDTGAKANNTTYHVFLIRKDSNESMDGLFSISYASPTMPSGYTYKRRIGSIRTDGGGVIRPFLQYANDFWYKTPVVDVSVANLGTTRNNYTLSVPSGLEVIVHVNILTSHASSNHFIYLSNPNLADLAPSSTVSPLGSMVMQAQMPAIEKIDLLTNANAEISGRSTHVNTTLIVATLGWTGRRI